MKIERVEEKSSPGYPSFNERRFRRRSALKVMLGGVVALFAAGCKFFTDDTTHASPAKGAKSATPEPPKELPLEPPAMVDGDMIMPEPPAVGGKPIQPSPPKHRGEIAPVEPPKLRGKIVPVKPPQK